MQQPPPPAHATDLPAGLDWAGRAAAAQQLLAAAEYLISRQVPMPGEAEGLLAALLVSGLGVEGAGKLRLNVAAMVGGLEPSRLLIWHHQHVQQQTQRQQQTQPRQQRRPARWWAFCGGRAGSHAQAAAPTPTTAPTAEAAAAAAVAAAAAAAVAASAHEQQRAAISAVGHVLLVLLTGPPMPQQPDHGSLAEMLSRGQAGQLADRSAGVCPPRVASLLLEAAWLCLAAAPEVPTAPGSWLGRLLAGRAAAVAEAPRQRAAVGGGEGGGGGWALDWARLREVAGGLGQEARQLALRWAVAGPGGKPELRAAALHVPAACCACACGAGTVDASGSWQVQHRRQQPLRPARLAMPRGRRGGGAGEGAPPAG